MIRQGPEIHRKLAHKIGARDLIYIFTGYRQRRRRPVPGHVQQPHELLMELRIQTFLDGVRLPRVVDAGELEGAAGVGTCAKTTGESRD